MKILIVAGSSGGHIFPAIATAVKIKESDAKNEIFFVGSEKGIDAKIFKHEGYNFNTLSSNKQIIKDLFSSFSILHKVKPDIVMGFGGYISFPVLMTARMLGIATVIHEQNMVPGVANKILANFVNRITVSFKETNNCFLRKSAVRDTGNPLKVNLIRLDKTRALEKFGLDLEKFTVLAMGGSQGAHFINKTVLDMLKSIKKDVRDRLQMIHLSGVQDFEFVDSGYRSLGIRNKVFSFFDRMSQAYSASDLVISRAGATSIAEFTFFGLPAILIPYPNIRVHQVENARFLEENKSAIVIQQKDLSPQLLKEEVLGLMEDKRCLKEMAENSQRLARPDATEKVFENIIELFNERK